MTQRRIEYDATAAKQKVIAPPDRDCTAQNAQDKANKSPWKSIEVRRSLEDVSSLALRSHCWLVFCALGDVGTDAIERGSRLMVSLSLALGVCM